MAEWRPIAGRPGFEVNATGRVRRAPHVMVAGERFSVTRLPDGNFISRDNAAQVRIAIDPDPEPENDDEDEEQSEVSLEPIPLQPPAGWLKGQLLNVRNRGEYVVTLLGEEDEPPLRPAPSGALRFPNSAKCQEFISRWYARESYDPRAR
jgi:hypothetical protein